MSASTHIARTIGHLTCLSGRSGLYWITVVIILILVRSWSYQQIATLLGVVAMSLLLNPASSRTAIS